MSDLLARLWPAFQAESSEQLESLELALSATEVGALDINDLFRAMHTIKGGCAMMGFGSMEAVAHEAEDLLDILRRGDMPLDDHLVDVLLESVDALKGQLQEAVNTRAAPQPAPSVVRRLRELVEASASGGDAPPASSPSPSSTDRATENPQTASGRADTPSCEGADASCKQRMERFAGFCRQNLSSLVNARLFATRRPQAETGDLVQLARASGLSALGVLAERAFSSGPADLEADIAALLWRLHELEHEQGLDIGVAATTKMLAARLVDARQAAISALAQSMQHLQGDDIADVAIVSASLSHAESLRDRLILSGAFRSAALMQVVMQTMRDLTRGAIGADAQLLELLGIAATLPQELDDQAVEDAAYQAMCDQVMERLLECVTRVAGGDAVQRNQDYLARHTPLCRETLQALSENALELLREAAQRGERIFEIDGDLEASDEAGEKLVSWLRESASVFTSYTIFGERDDSGVSQRTRFGLVAAIPSGTTSPEMLLARLETEGLRAQLVEPCLTDASSASQDKLSTGQEPGRASRESPESNAMPDSTAGTSTMRVDSSVLDRFVDRVGEMVMLRNALAYSQHDDHLLNSLRSCRAKLSAGGARLTPGDVQALSGLLHELDVRLDGLSQADTRLQGALNRLQEDVLALRVVPLAVLFNRLPRVVRDLSRSQNKHIDIAFSGEDLRVDKGMVDVLLEPLMHMVRNCVDHGIETPAERAASAKSETATLTIAATQSGGVLNLEIRDDGRGLDYDAIRRKATAMGIFSHDQARQASHEDLAALIFNPGFSTAQRVTEVSGRGVGMDVVRTRINHVGGSIRVLSEPGKGTSFHLRLPLTVAIQNVLLVQSGTSQYAIPERYVAEVVSLEQDALQSVQSQAACLLRGAMLPLYGLGELLGIAQSESAEAGRERRQVAVLATGSMRIGVLVDAILGRPEVFVRDVHPDIARMPAIGGVCILGGGEVVVILDGDGLVDLAGRNAQSIHDLLCAS